MIELLAASGYLHAFDFGAISFLIEDAEPKAEQVTPIKRRAKAA